MSAAKSVDSKPHIHNQYKLPLTAVTLYVNQGFLKKLVQRHIVFVIRLLDWIPEKEKSQYYQML